MDIKPMAYRETRAEDLTRAVGFYLIRLFSLDGIAELATQILPT